MNILETEWWSLALPPEWWADREEDSILIGDRDSVGSIEVSTLHSDSGAFELAQIKQLAQANSEGDWSWDTATVGAYTGIVTRYQDEGDAVREWYVACDEILLFITYSCELENAGLDDAAVDEMLATLTPSQGTLSESS
ncbi:MAG: hypothetical protein AAGI24_06870 [Pseudomonadota bacterium]